MSALPQQLDIFADSRDVMLRNDVLGALAKRDAVTARAACTTLGEAFPADPHLALFDTLIEALEQQTDAPVSDPADAASQRAALAGPLDAAARQAFGAVAAKAWMQPAWRSLASRCAGLAFDPARADDHAAAFCLQAEDWAMAADATAGIESWRRIPGPLGWMTEARYRLQGLEAVWPLLTELAWLAPRRFGGMLARMHDPLLARLQKKFDAAFDGAGDASDLAWFPAWLLTCAPALAPHLAPALASNHTPAEQAMRLLLDLLALERQGRHHDLVPRRQTLRQLNESLYSIYLSTR